MYIFKEGFVSKNKMSADSEKQRKISGVEKGGKIENTHLYRGSLEPFSLISTVLTCKRNK